jgi:hypothetical protein
MKYNLLLMLNDSYMNFAIIFLNSLYKNTKISRINNIIINNIGLSDKNKDILSKKYNKIVFFDTQKNLGFTKIHSKEWLDALTMKTKTLLKVIQEYNNIPIILIDSDMLVLRDFHKFIDTTYDLQICKCKNPYRRKDLEIKQLDYIACFAIINNNSENVQNFIKEWIIEIEYMSKNNLKPAYETPSMCKMIQKYKNIIKIGDLNQDEIACDIEYIQDVSYLIHMRSNGPQGHNHFNERISNIKNYSKDNVLKYLDI